MCRLYLAGPLFCAAETEYNRALGCALERLGYEPVLPQDVPMKIDPERMKEPAYRDGITLKVFRADLALLESCDALVINLDGRVPDEGACFELGYAFAKGMRCFAIKTDVRSAEYGTDNMMIGGAIGLKIAGDAESLASMLADAGLKPRD